MNAKHDSALPADGKVLGWKRLRGLFRRGEVYVTALAVGIGAAVGIVVLSMGRLAQLMHLVLFGISPGVGLSAATELPRLSLLIPAAGGLVLGLSLLALRQWGKHPIVDPIEANALHGGRMSITDSVVVAIQTVLSNGVGASVGLEAGYTQMGGAIASRLGQVFRLRRQDVRTLVGCGTAAAIAAAFNAPFTGAFYAFELIIGAYTIAGMAPVMASAVAAVLVVNALGGAPVPLDFGVLEPVELAEYPIFIALGLICGLVGIALMRSVSLVEVLVLKLPIPPVLRPMAGGLVLGGLALFSPHVLSAGHGALHLHFHEYLPLGAMVIAFLLKGLASAVSLGTGFRGGLFFASLFLGALLGKILATMIVILWPAVGVDPVAMSLVGMSALAVSIVGGPLTMTFLALEATGDFRMTGVALAASIAASMTVRELFGYSFSTWRLHLRGETIRSAHDVGWMRNLTVARMMRTAVPIVNEGLLLSDFRDRFPLGSETRVVVTDSADRYCGIIVVAEAHTPDPGGQRGRKVADLLKREPAVLTPCMNVKQAIDLFEQVESEALVVVENGPSAGVVGILTERHALRRYSQELDQARRGATGEGI